MPANFVSIDRHRPLQFSSDRGGHLVMSINVPYLCCGEHHTDHSTLCEFRKDNKDAYNKVFVDVLALAQEMKLLKKVGTISAGLPYLKERRNLSP